MSTAIADTPISGRIYNGLLLAGKTEMHLEAARLLAKLAEARHKEWLRTDQEDDREGAVTSCALNLARDVREDLDARLEQQIRDLADEAVAAGVTPATFREIVHHWWQGEHTDLPVELVGTAILSRHSRLSDDYI